MSSEEGSARGRVTKRRSVARFGPDDGRRLVIDDPATLKALYDPLRFEIIGHLSEPTSVKELAERLDRKPSGLYHHIGLLEEKGLIEVAEERVVGRRLERLYRRAFSTYETSEDLSDAVGGLMADSSISGAVRHLRRAMRAEDGDAGDRTEVRFVAEVNTELSLAQATAVEQAVLDVIEQHLTRILGDDALVDEGATRQSYRLLLSMAPDDETDETTSEDQGRPEGG